MSLSVICVMIGLSTAPVPPQEVEARVADVVVIGRRGAARVPPEIELDPERIDDLGAYDISEAIERLGQGLGFDRPPVLIINGRRVVSPGDFLGFPPDALERMEVLPQSATATYGGDPTQRVVNLVLRPRFVSRDGQASAERPTAGGRTGASLDARQSSIRDSDVTQYGARLSRETALYGAERPGYLADNPGRADVTLRPSGETVAANATIRRALGDWSGSLGARAQRRTDRFASLTGAGIVETRRETDAAALTAGLGGDLAGWSVRLGLDGQATRARQDGLTDLAARTASTAIDLGADRTVIDLPAGPLTVNLTGRYGRFRSDIETQAAETHRTVGTLDLGGNVSIPLTRSAATAPGTLWGDTTLTLGATVRDTDGTSGRSLKAGASWTPSRKMRINGQWSETTEGPTAQQRFDPPILGEPQTVFDFATGQAVDVLPLFGGNPDLRTPTTQLASLAVSVGPFTRWTVQGGLDLQATRARDGIGGLPALTPEVEVAFPDRFLRDADGRLTIIDRRPLNLASARTESLSSNLSFTLPSGGGAAGAVPGTWRVALTHTWQLTNRLSLIPQLAELDRLAGDGGGVPRHAASLLLDGRIGPWGVNGSARWQGGSRLRRDVGRDGPGDLELNPLATIDLKLSYLFQPNARSDREDEGTRRGGGVRLELEIDNLFDARPGARLGDGRPAPGYGRDDQDPLGRVVRITASRRF